MSQLASKSPVIFFLFWFSAAGHWTKFVLVSGLWQPWLFGAVTALVIRRCHIFQRFNVVTSALCQTCLCNFDAFPVFFFTRGVGLPALQSVERIPHLANFLKPPFAPIFISQLNPWKMFVLIGVRITVEIAAWYTVWPEMSATFTIFLIFNF